MSDNNRDFLRESWRKSYAGLGAVAVFSVFINILKLTAPLYVIQILHRVLSSRSHETLILLTLITVVATITAILLEVVRTRMFLHWGGWIERTFGPKLFDIGLRKEPGEGPSSSNMLRDVATVRSFVSGSGMIAWLDVVWAPVFIFCVFLICVPLAYIVLTAVLIALALGTLNEVATRESRSATSKARRDDREWITLAERNRDTVGSLSMASNIAERWSRSALERLDEGMRTRVTNIYFVAALRFVGRGLRISVYAVGLWLVINHDLTFGTIIGVSLLGRTAFSLVSSAMTRWRDMLTARRAYQRIKSALKKDTVRQVSVPNTSSAVSLHLVDVAHRYPYQDSSVFRDLEVTVEPGEVLCVIGQSATGKTTLSRLVSGSMRPRSGKIRLGDVDVSRLQQLHTKRVLGHLPQDVVLFEGTVRENIASMARGNIRKVIRAAKLAGIHDIILNLPHGYDTEICENEPLLSTGQRKCIAIARAFYGSPNLIVMDEPTQHLDDSARLALMTAIMRLKRKGVIVVVTMRSNILSDVADKVILLSKTKRCEILQTREEVTALKGDNAASNIRSFNRRDSNRTREKTSSEINGTDNENSKTA